jgi:hypothetical protein
MSTFTRQQARSQRGFSKFNKSHAAPSQVSKVPQPMLRLQRTIGNRAVQRLLVPESLQTGSKYVRGVGGQVRQLSAAKGASAASSPARLRKCVTCESTRSLCPGCAEEESAQERTRAIATTPAAERRIDRGEGSGMEDLPVPMKDDGKKGPAKPPQKPKCPTQTVTISGAKCGSSYGAVAKYCYSGIKGKGWWFKEKVKNATGTLCQPGTINQTSNPFQSPLDDCVEDAIFDNNGPPSNVAPCTDTTFQTVFIGPTKADVEQCPYKNTQVIKVTAAKDKKSGKVITTSAGVATDCAWP